MFLPSEQAPLPPTSPKPLISRQAQSQTLPPRAWATPEIAAVTLAVILGVIILIALGYLANRVLVSLMEKMEQTVYERVQEDLLPTRERLNAALGIGNSQEHGPLGQDSLPRQQFGRRASPPPSPPAERQSDIENFPHYRFPSPLDLGQNSQRPDPPYRGRLHHPTIYHRAHSPSPVRREWERETQAPVDGYRTILPRPRRARSASPQPSSRGSEQNWRQRDTVDSDRSDRIHGPRQSGLRPRHEPLRQEDVHQEGVRYVPVHVNLVNNSIQSNGPYDYEAGLEYGY